MFGFNGIFRKYPYMDFNEYNLDWLLEQMKSLETAFNDFAAANHLVYADPVTWDITTTYNPNTIVVKMPEEVAYISLKRVPAGTPITDTEYWSAVFDASNYNLLQDQINSLSLQLGTLNGYINDLEAGTSLPAFVKYPAMNFTNSYAVCFGDSNTLETEPSGYGNTFHRICDYIRPKNKKSYGQNSAAFQNGITGCPVIGDQIAGANDFPAAEVGLVFVMGGINDYHYGTINATAFGNAVGSTINAIHTKFPNALIVAAMDSGSRLPNGTLLLYQAAFARGAANNTSGAPVVVVSLADIPLQESLFVNTNHYNGLGASAIATRVINKVFGGGTGYQIAAPRRTVKHYTSGDTGENGAYNFYVATVTTIDPDTLIRRDWHRICTETTFNAGGSSSAAEFCKLPGTYQPAYYFGDNGTFAPMTLLRNTGSKDIVMKLENVYRDTPTKEPYFTVKNIYDETLTNYRGYMEFETIITMWDTGE